MCATVVAITARFGLAMYGVPWITKKKILSDYSKWLGPNWKVDPALSFTGASTFVSNHQTFADIYVQLALHSRSPGYVAKDLIRKVPGIGYVAEVIL